MPSAIPPAMREAWCPTSVSPSQTNPAAINMSAGSVQRVTMRLMVAVIFMGSSELLGGGGILTCFLSVASRVLVISSFLFSEQPSAEHHAIVKDDVCCLSIPKR